MKFKQKILLLMMILLILLSTPMAFATDSSLDDIGVKLKALGLLVGDPDGNMRFAENISRAEFTAIAVRLIGKEDLALSKKGTTIFPDVPADHWSSGHINVAVDNDIIHGYDDGTFGLKKSITYGEALTIIINVLGYQDEVMDGTWPDNYVEKSKALGITENMTFKNGSSATRGDIARFLDNSLDVVYKRK